MDDVKKTRIKEYQAFLSGIDKGSKEEKILKGLQIILEISNDFKKDNSLEKLGENEEFTSSDGIVWNEISTELKVLYDYLEINNGKKIIRQVQDLSQRTSQLHEKINYIAVQRELEALGDDWKARKKHVDSLYSGFENRNKVWSSCTAVFSCEQSCQQWYFIRYCKKDTRTYRSRCSKALCENRHRTLEKMCS